MSYYQKYYKKNREQILLKYKEKHREKKPTLCECGETINYRGLYQHKKTVKHKNKIEQKIDQRERRKKYKLEIRIKRIIMLKLMTDN